ncbi:MAG: hypothetical protein CSA26_03430 [Desulfobacterales bacterium]|nr:MAG: hypothetical protein CSA26_03430 [Desulfobacterales bacterium]
MTTNQYPANGKTRDGAKVTKSGLFKDYNKTAAETQRELFLDHLNTFGSISTLEAREMGILSPNSVVYRLRRKGHRIVSEKVIEAGHRVANYRFMTLEEIEKEKKEAAYENAGH